MPRKKLTRALVKDFAKFAEANFRCKIVHYRDTKSLGQYLLASKMMGNTLGIVLSLNGEVILPFHVGTSSMPLIIQVYTIAHDLQHIRQQQRDDGFERKYLGSRSYRAHKEQRAVHAQLDMMVYLYGQYLQVWEKQAVEMLRGYRLKNKHLAVVRRYLETVRPMVSTGKVTNRVSKDCIRWLDGRVR
jgi:hypothetical protein